IPALSGRALILGSKRSPQPSRYSAVRYRSSFIRPSPTGCSRGAMSGSGSCTKGLRSWKQRPEALTVEEMLDDPRFIDAVVSGARTVEHTHQQEKLGALHNA